MRSGPRYKKLVTLPKSLSANRCIRLLQCIKPALALRYKRWGVKSKQLQRGAAIKRLTNLRHKSRVSNISFPQSRENCQQDACTDNACNSICCLAEVSASNRIVLRESTFKSAPFTDCH